MEAARSSRRAISRSGESEAIPREMSSRSASVSASRERRRAAGGMPPRGNNTERMQLCGLSKARPISCSDCPAFHRLQTSRFLDRRKPKSLSLPSCQHHLYTEQTYIRWCCIDPSNAPRLSGLGSTHEANLIWSSTTSNLVLHYLGIHPSCSKIRTKHNVVLGLPRSHPRAEISSSSQVRPLRIACVP